VEIIVVYLWALVIRAVSITGIVLMGIFLVVLMFGEFYAWKKGDLRWH
jgi:NADH-quinone oxidoreductase subunit A